MNVVMGPLTNIDQVIGKQGGIERLKLGANIIGPVEEGIFSLLPAIGVRKKVGLPSQDQVRCRRHFIRLRAFHCS